MVTAVTTTSTNAKTVWIKGDDSEIKEWQCHERFEGEHGIFDYGHHVCPHDSPLFRLIPEDPSGLICGHCGKTFGVEEPDA